MWAYQNALSSHGPFLEGLGSDEIGVGEFWPLQNFMTCTCLVLSPRLKKNSSLGCYLVCCASLPWKVVRKGPSLKPISVMVIFYKRLIFLFYVILLLACFLLLGVFLFLPSEIYCPCTGLFRTNCDPEENNTCTVLFRTNCDPEENTSASQSSSL